MVIQQLVDEVRTSLEFLIFHLAINKAPLVCSSSFDIDFTVQVFYVGRLVVVDVKDTVLAQSGDTRRRLVVSKRS